MEDTALERRYDLVSKNCKTIKSNIADCLQRERRLKTHLGNKDKITESNNRK